VIFNCCPAESERVIATQPCVAQVAMIGVADARLGEIGHGVRRAGSGHFAVRATDWSAPFAQQFCRERVANYKVPRRFALVKEWPLNASGEVIKGLLRAKVM
jgi:acyl-CoA synthetase (AMP-forming)/AMP-acid ligase II